jgi:hypothetical protein
MKKIITGKNIYYIGGKYEDKYYLLFDNHTALEVNSSDYDNYQPGDEYFGSEDQEQKIIENFSGDSLMLGKKDVEKTVHKPLFHNNLTKLPKARAKRLQNWVKLRKKVNATFFKPKI